ncbi:hypothetical protein CcCBS67573_g07545 [Chytriomyces confervae]|uniref:Uncharacterized protein n=1 Tax=Chytriomyces confervae TaxID=246404 RepID=A0A507ESS5_9FUNG|nr:hypothetical protein CcCBS67573_g07545 [Chytriomyces confervae]
MQQTIWTNSDINLTEGGMDRFAEISEDTNEKCHADIAELSNLLILLKSFVQ